MPFQGLGAGASRNAAQTAVDAKLAVTRSVAVIRDPAGRFPGVETAVGGYGVSR